MLSGDSVALLILLALLALHFLLSTSLLLRKFCDPLSGRQNKVDRSMVRRTVAERRMDEQEEYAAASVRKFLTVLFTLRARRHLQRLAEIYGWSPEELAKNEARFIQPSNFVPVWSQ